MSHLSTINVQISDLNALEAACKELGITFAKGDTHCTSAFFDQTCEHTIKVPDCSWSIGLFADGRTAAGKQTYKLGFDKWGNEGRKLLDAIGGEDAGKLVQAYTVAKVTLDAKAKGYVVSRQRKANGTVALVVSGM